MHSMLTLISDILTIIIHKDKWNVNIVIITLSMKIRNIERLWLWVVKLLVSLCNFFVIDFIFQTHKSKTHRHRVIIILYFTWDVCIIFQYCKRTWSEISQFWFFTLLFILKLRCNLNCNIYLSSVKPMF